MEYGVFALLVLVLTPVICMYCCLALFPFFFCPPPRLEQAQFTKADINKTRTNYVPAAKRGSILFFAMAGLSNVEKMYEISLSSFLAVFRRSLQQAKKDVNVRACSVCRVLTSRFPHTLLAAPPPLTLALCCTLII